MFDLRREMAAWRARLEAEDGLRGADIEELEDHLCEQVTELALRGLSEEEAFSTATQRLGGTKCLAEEFGKVNGSQVWRRRVTWMISGWLVAMVVGRIFGFPLTAGFLLAAGEGWLRYGSSDNPWLASLLPSLALNAVFLTALLTVVIRVHRAGAADGLLDRILAWSARRWYLVATILILIPVARFAWGLWAVRVFAPESFGIAAISLFYRAIFWTTIGPLAVLGLLVWLRRRDRSASDVALTWMVAGWLVALVLGGVVGLVQQVGYLLAANQGWLGYHSVGIIWPGQLLASLAVNIVFLIALLSVVLRVHGAGATDSAFARVVAWSARRWYWAATILVLIPVVGTVWHLCLTRLFTMESLGTASIASNYGALFWTTIGPLTVLGLLVWLRRRDREASGAALVSE